MKKLLTLSVLATTLASTAAFAQMTTANYSRNSTDSTSMKYPTSAQSSAGKTGVKGDAPIVLEVAKNASKPTIKGFQIAQALVEALEGQNNKAKKAVLSFNDQGTPEKAEIMLEKKVTAENVDAIQEAVLASTRLANEQLGWAAIVANPGKGSDIVTIHAISHIEGNDYVVAIVAKLTDGGKKIIIVQTPAVDKATADKLLKAKAAANLAPVEGKGKGKGKGKGSSRS